MNASLDALARPFRTTYLDHDDVTAQLRAWAEAYPTLARVESAGRTTEGRDLWVLTIGPEPDRARPAVWVDANMHASELCGSSVALAIAEDFLRLHLTPDAPPHGLPAHVADHLREVLVYVMPRMSPDGAERILTTGRWVRSSTRDERAHRAAARWMHADIDGDGVSQRIRVRDPAGEYVEHPRCPGALTPRTLEDTGPYYRLYPEGTIDGWDGDSVPDPDTLSDNETDLNRNFPVGWKPEPEQRGAGVHALSEPESRAVVAYTSRRPHIFAWLNLHCFGGVVIRPPGDVPDAKMPADERALYRQLEDWATRFSGYPTVSGFEEFTYEPGKPIAGDLMDYAYEARGCFSWVVELWDIFARLGIPRPRRFVEIYEQTGPELLERLWRFDRERNEGRMFPAWRAAEHPQLGPVEVGGFDPRFGLWNPPYEEIAGICEAQAAIFMRVAGLAPRVEVLAEVSALGEGRVAVDVDVVNVGYLPTYILPSRRALSLNEPLYLEIAPLPGSAGAGVTVEAPAQRRVELGHLEGWGRGKNHPAQSLIFPKSRGSSNRRRVRLVLSGEGTVRLRVGACRVGWQVVDVDVPAG